MRLQDKYVLAEALPVLAVAIAGCLVVLLANSLYVLLSSSLADFTQVQLGLLGRFAILKLPSALVLALPVATLLACCLAVVRLARDRELFALCAAGVPLYRLFIPLLALAVLAGALTFWLQGWLAPEADYQARVTARHLLYARKKLFPLPNHFFYLGKGYHFYAAAADQARRRLEGVYLFKLEPDGPPTLFVADSAQLTPEGTWKFAHALVLRANSSGRLVLLQTKQFLADLRRYTPRPGPVRRLPKYLPLPELAAGIAKAKSQGQHKYSYLAEYQFRLALPVTALLLVAAGLPLAWRFAEGGGYVGLVLAFGLSFACYLALIWLKGLVGTGALAPAVALALPAGGLLALAGWGAWSLR